MKTGRNAPCPCGSGKKYKKCCLPRGAAAVSFSRQQRAEALEKLERYAGKHYELEDEYAYDELWGEWADRVDVEQDGVDEDLLLMSDDVLDSWFFFDRPLPGGELLVDRFFKEGPPLAAAERRFLELCRGSCMRLYVVEDLRPGVSVTLREALDGGRVTVHEETGSRHFRRADMLAARVIERGASGEPEIERGALPIHGLLRDTVESQLAAHREDFRREHPRSTDAEFYKEAVPFFHEAWISAIVEPPIPHLQNTDGEDMLPTRTRYEVLDRPGLERALDAAGDLERNPAEEGAWGWSGLNARGEQISLGRLVLEGSALVMETNSVERDRRGRDMLEGLRPGTVRHLGTVHEDLEQQLREALRSGALEDGQEDGRGHGLPPEVAEDLLLDRQACHYREWLDMEIPKLDGRTPRQAAKDPKLVQRLAGMIRDLEGSYHHALRHDRPAYDPSWLWDEEAAADALYGGGGDDALFCVSGGVYEVEFDREAPTFREAVLSAISDVNGAGIGSRVVRVVPDDLVNANTIAERSGKTRQAVRYWYLGERGEGFPAPRAIVGKSPVWSWVSVARWLHGRGELDADAVESAQVIAEINRKIEAAAEQDEQQAGAMAAGI